MVNCQFGRRGRIGCQAASLPPDPRSPGWQPVGRVSQAGRHPIAPLSVKLTIDEHYHVSIVVRELQGEILEKFQNFSETTTDVGNADDENDEIRMTNDESMLE